MLSKLGTYWADFGQFSAIIKVAATGEPIAEFNLYSLRLEFNFGQPAALWKHKEVLDLCDQIMISTTNFKTLTK